MIRCWLFFIAIFIRIECTYIDKCKIINRFCCMLLFILTSDDKLFEMISLQEISGEWKLSKEIVDLLGVNTETIQSMNNVSSF